MPEMLQPWENDALASLEPQITEHRCEVRQHSCQPRIIMALIEEIEDDKPRSPSPIQFEEITDEEDEQPRKPKAPPPPPAATSTPPALVSEFQKKLQDLTSKMALPSDLLPAFMSEQAGELLYRHRRWKADSSAGRLRVVQGPGAAVPLATLSSHSDA